MTLFLSNVSQNKSDKYNKEENSENYIVESIIKYDDHVIRLIYKEYFLKIKKMVYTFRNTMLNPEDIFQEGLTSSFYTYLNSVCYRVCLKELKNKTLYSESAVEIPFQEEEDQMEIIERVLLIRNQLELKCRQIIDLRFALTSQIIQDEVLKCKSHEEIAEELAITPDNARQRLKRCMDKLKQLVYNDNEITEQLRQ
jgi:RNA polymerase sigma factor (sigma-70 family)